MSVKSIFEFKFSAESRDVGVTLAKGIGGDMPPLDGYLDYEVVQDIADPGHVMVITHWVDSDHANAVLSSYRHDPKIEKVTQLLSGSPSGFIGRVL